MAISFFVEPTPQNLYNVQSLCENKYLLAISLPLIVFKLIQSTIQFKMLHHGYTEQEFCGRKDFKPIAKATEIIFNSNWMNSNTRDMQYLAE